MTDRQVFTPLALRAEGLVCGRGGVPLTPPVNLTMASGHCLLLRGANGTGKTTLLLTLAGILSPLSGGISLQGADPEARPRLHYCGHLNALKPRLSVVESLEFWANVNGRSGMSTIKALDVVGLVRLGRIDAGYLSAGQARRLALARLLVSLRPLWLLDEPTATLDSEGHAMVTHLLDQHLAMGGMAVIATHDPIILSSSDQPDILYMDTR